MCRREWFADRGGFFSRPFTAPKTLWIVFLVLTLASCASHTVEAEKDILTTRAQVASTVEANEDVVTTSVQVDSVEVILLYTFPYRVKIVVHGQKAHDVDVDVSQEQEGMEVTVTMTQTHPRRLQPRMGPFTKSVFLKGGFKSGTYLLRVNDYSKTLKIR